MTGLCLRLGLQRNNFATRCTVNSSDLGLKDVAVHSMQAQGYIKASEQLWQKRKEQLKNDLTSITP